MRKDEQLLEKRLIELSKAAYHRERITYSDFLNLNELNILHSLPKDSLYTKYEIFGGYESAERQLAAFIPDALSLRGASERREELFADAISVIRIEPLQTKFSEELSHRDYLGAILNLGIDRSKIGDIVIEHHRAYLFVRPQMKDFLLENLCRIRHTSVMVEEEMPENFSYVPKFEKIRGTVASVRLDSLSSLAFATSRSKLCNLIEEGKVFVNGRLITSNAYQPKEEDRISVRGMGKFQYKGITGITKKNRTSVLIHKYV